MIWPKLNGDDNLDLSAICVLLGNWVKKRICLDREVTHVFVIV
jgi:hypothetical protein